MNATEESDYSDAVIGSIEMVYGKNFLSPGGPEEVARIVDGLTIEGELVLDLGCGLGGGSLALAGDLGAAKVISIDVDPDMVARTARAADALGLAGKIEPRNVEPGPIPYPDDTFDLVFSKDVIAHVPDKAAFYAEIFRVLKPGGAFAGSDWHKAAKDHSQAFEDWAGQLRDSGLWFEFTPVEGHRDLMVAAGFQDISIVDRRVAISEGEKSLVRIRDTSRDALIALMGEDGLAGLEFRTEARLCALRAGDLQHCRLRARKPG
ncbi:MAG: methyltransferase domain-containing protein [Rhodobacteraceae bacterium]|nr:methyltransferase domain-containing protein [Paracoccaceae bacterium]